MSSDPLATLAAIAAILSEGGYAIRDQEIGGAPAVLAENPYALVAVVEFVDWDQLERRVFDCQAELTELAADSRSARDWDMYLFVHVLASLDDSEHLALVEAIEADTRYARKLVRAGLSEAALDRALRPFLPLRPAAEFDLADPLEQLRQELSRLAVEETVAATAIAAFKADAEVRLP